MQAQRSERRPDRNETFSGSIEFTIPVDLAAWQNRRTTQAEAMSAASVLIKYAATEALAGRDPIACPVHLTILAFFLPPGAAKFRRGDLCHTGRPDTDSVAAVIMSALDGIAWKQRGQVAELFVMKRYGPRPGIAVVIEPADDLMTMATIGEA